VLGVPGSRSKRRQMRMREHMKEPRTMLERQAEAMEVDATIMNLENGSVES